MIAPKQSASRHKDSSTSKLGLKKKKSSERKRLEKSSSPSTKPIRNPSLKKSKQDSDTARAAPKSKKKLEARVEKIEKYLQDRWNWLGVPRKPSPPKKVDPGSMSELLTPNRRARGLAALRDKGRHLRCRFQPSTISESVAHDPGEVN